MSASLTCHSFTVKRQHRYLCQTLELAIHPGERWVILGPNGCGKSTFLHAIANLHDDVSGQLMLYEKNIQAWRPRERAQQIGILLQETPQVFAQTIKEICLTSRYPHQSYWQQNQKIDLAIVQEALTIMDLLPFANHKGNELSGGEKKRLSIAALLSQTPNIYLLDEPFNHLDIPHQMQLLQHLHTLSAQQKTILLTTHDVNLAYYFATHALLIFPQGRIKAGKKHDILTSEALSDLYQHPFSWQINQFEWLSQNLKTS